MSASEYITVLLHHAYQTAGLAVTLLVLVACQIDIADKRALILRWTSYLYAFSSYLLQT